MFLFTTPSTPPESVPPPAIARPAPGSANAGTAIPGPVVQAIRDGAMASGVGFDYLLATARRESGLDPAAKAATSSATGLFQFIEQTWLGTMKSAGPRLGLQAQADAITRQSDGTYAVPDSERRQAILDLRRDPKIASALAGALTQKNAESLGAALGREPTSGDLYAAHVLGAKGAASLIATARAFPERAAALDLPEAAAANRALFYDRTGRPRGAAELYASLSAAAHGSAATGAPAYDPAGPRQAGPVAAPVAATAAAFGGSGDLRSLFQTERRGAVSDAAARLWQGRGGVPPVQRPAPSYFPRSESGAEMAALDDGPTVTGSIATAQAVTAQALAPLTAAATAAGPILVNAPLPPRRPAELAPAAALMAAPLELGLRTTLFAPRSGP